MVDACGRHSAVKTQCSAADTLARCHRYFTKPVVAMVNRFQPQRLIPIAQPSSKRPIREERANGSEGFLAGIEIQFGLGTRPTRRSRSLSRRDISQSRTKAKSGPITAAKHDGVLNVRTPGSRAHNLCSRDRTALDGHQLQPLQEKAIRCGLVNAHTATSMGLGNLYDRKRSGRIIEISRN